MRLQINAPQERGEPIAPMINIVFLLLIFFLMSATMAPPLPVEAEPPQSSADGDARELSIVLAISAEGRMAYGSEGGETRWDDDAIVAAAAAAQQADLPVRIRIDAKAPASALIQAAAQLKKAGAKEVELTTQARAQ